MPDTIDWQVLATQYGPWIRAEGEQLAALQTITTPARPYKVEKLPYVCHDCGDTIHYTEKLYEVKVGGRVVSLYYYSRLLCVCEAAQQAKWDKEMALQKTWLERTRRDARRFQYQERWGLEGERCTYVLGGVPYKSCDICKQEGMDILPLKPRNDVVNFDVAATAAHELLRDFPDRKGFILAGDSHIGKSHIVGACVHLCVHRLEPVESVFINSGLLLSKIIKSDDNLDYYQRVPLLAVDELGEESLPPDHKEWMLDKFCRLLDTRTVNKRRTLMTTNKTQKEISERYNDKILNRMIRLCDWIHLKGEPYRANR